MKGFVNELAIQIDGRDGILPVPDGEIDVVFKKIAVALREYNIGQLEFKDNPLTLSERKTDISRGYYTAHVTGVKDQASDKILRMDLEAFNSLAIVFPIMFMSMAALTIYVLLNRLVQSQRPQIGVMKAIGYTRSQVLSHYLAYALVIAMSGSLMGTALGLYLADVFAYQYAEALNIPFVQSEVHWHVVAIGITVSIAICILGGLLPSLKTANMHPAQSLRPARTRRRGGTSAGTTHSVTGANANGNQVGFEEPGEEPLPELFSGYGYCLRCEPGAHIRCIPGFDKPAQGNPVQSCGSVRCPRLFQRIGAYQPLFRIGVLDWRQRF